MIIQIGLNFTGISSSVVYGNILNHQISVRSPNTGIISYLKLRKLNRNVGKIYSASQSQ